MSTKAERIAQLEKESARLAAELTRLADLWEVNDDSQTQNKIRRDYKTTFAAYLVADNELRALKQ